MQSRDPRHKHSNYTEGNTDSRQTARVVVGLLLDPSLLQVIQGSRAIADRRKLSVVQHPEVFTGAQRIQLVTGHPADLNRVRQRRRWCGLWCAVFPVPATGTTEVSRSLVQHLLLQLQTRLALQRLLTARCCKPLSTFTFFTRTLLFLRTLKRLALSIRPAALWLRMAVLNSVTTLRKRIPLWRSVALFPLPLALAQDLLFRRTSLATVVLQLLPFPRLGITGTRRNVHARVPPGVVLLLQAVLSLPV